MREPILSGDDYLSFAEMKTTPAAALLRMADDFFLERWRVQASVCDVLSVMWM